LNVTLLGDESTDETTLTDSNDVDLFLLIEFWVSLDVHAFLGSLIFHGCLQFGFSTFNMVAGTFLNFLD
jgi:hypothetical protein